MPGCLGTIGTRTGGDGVGKYPYMAVAADVAFPIHYFNEPNESWGSITAAAIVGIISIPLDFVIDTVLLPVDLIAWPLGGKKGFLGGTNANL